MPAKRRKFKVTARGREYITDENSGQPSARAARFSARHPLPADAAPTQDASDAAPADEPDEATPWDELDQNRKDAFSDRMRREHAQKLDEAQEHLDQVLAREHTELEAAQARIRLLEADKAGLENALEDLEAHYEDMCDNYHLAKDKADHFDALFGLISERRMLEACD